MLAVIATLLLSALALGVAMRRLPRRMGAGDARPSADEIDAVLPQTQCGLCSYPGCRPYAEAIARGDADINQCPPGGDTGIRALAKLLRVRPKPLNPKHGSAKTTKTVAVIDEHRCIGCTLCIQACPVDAILGANKQMHSVITDECTGCELCIAPCPVDCIRMVPAQDAARGRIAALMNRRRDRIRAKEKADMARKRYQFRLQRLAREQAEREARLRAKSVQAASADVHAEIPDRQNAVLASIARARAKREGKPVQPAMGAPDGESKMGR